MSQLSTLLWLKWSLFRHSLRSKMAVVSRVFSLLAILMALAIALSIAFGLGIAAYFLTLPNSGLEAAMQTRQAHGGQSLPSTEFLFFSIFGLCYLIWATLPLSIGSNRQFDPGNLLLYPISLGKL